MEEEWVGGYACAAAAVDAAHLFSGLFGDPAVRPRAARRRCRRRGRSLLLRSWDGWGAGE